jgi:hypothetical protein
LYAAAGLPCYGENPAGLRGLAVANAANTHPQNINEKCLWCFTAKRNTLLIK